jgi:hypothetical protein
MAISFVLPYRIENHEDITILSRTSSGMCTDLNGRDVVWNKFDNARVAGLCVANLTTTPLSPALLSTPNYRPMASPPVGRRFHAKLQFVEDTSGVAPV